MKPGLRPPIIGQIFSPVPAARSRCLSAFVAIARQALPLPMRYEPSHLLALCGVILLVLVIFTGTSSGYGSMMNMVGWCSLGLAFLASLGQDRLLFGRTRWRLIRQLDEIRRSVGLDRAILPESLEFLEATAQQWERVEHALQAQVWREQDALRQRISQAAHTAMEDVVVLECGSTSEAGMTDEDADRTLTEMAGRLSLLADQVDAASSALMSYPREEFDSNGMPPSNVFPALESLELALADLGEPGDT